MSEQPAATPQAQMEVDGSTAAAPAPAAATPAVSTPAPAASIPATTTPVQAEATPAAATPVAATPAAASPAQLDTTATAAADAGTPAGSTEDKKAKDKRKELPIRQYLDTTVVPVLLAGMSQLTKERPDTDEVEWLANWMIKNNPNKKQKSSA